MPDGAAGKNKRKTHCPSGHPYSKDNTVYAKNGARGCRICKAAYLKRYHKRRKLLLEDLSGKDADD